MITKDTQFYGVCLKPYNNGVTRWAVYYAPETPNQQLERLWPIDGSNHKAAKAAGWTYDSKHDSRLPAYHIKISEIGTSHHYLLKAAIAGILSCEHGVNIENANTVRLQIL